MDATRSEHDAGNGAANGAASGAASDRDWVTAPPRPRSNNAILHLLWTLPGALAFSFVIWGGCRMFAVASWHPTYSLENPYLMPALGALALASVTIGIAVAMPRWAPSRERKVVFALVSVVAFAIFLILLPQQTVGWTFN
jgi:hypothetical protein